MDKRLVDLILKTPEKYEPFLNVVKKMVHMHSALIKGEIDCVIWQDLELKKDAIDAILEAYGRIAGSESMEDIDNLKKYVNEHYDSIKRTFFGIYE